MTTDVDKWTCSVKGCYELADFIGYCQEHAYENEPFYEPAEPVEAYESDY